MQTSIVINAGLGGLTLGIEQAGYRVIAAYEADKKALQIHEKNLDVPIYNHIPLKKEYTERFDLDLLAAHLHFQPYSSTSKFSSYPIQDYNNIIELLSYYQPNNYLFFINPSSRKHTLPDFLERISQIGYKYEYRDIDIGEITNLPIKERIICVVGARNDINFHFSFAYYNYSKPLNIENLLQLGQNINPWYYHIRYDKFPHDIGDYRFLCWNRNGYTPTDTIKWNYTQIPLVRDIEGPRKITHREIANFKNFPEKFVFSEEGNKSWLYKSLMYSENVEVVKQITKKINNNFEKKINRGLQFENLFADYLNHLAKKYEKNRIIIERESHSNDSIFDFKVSTGNQILLFELKLYHNNIAIASKISSACKQISILNKEEIPILVVANELSNTIKSQCFEKYGIYIWDVGNLLWLFEEFPELKSEFVAFLDYTVDNIEAIKPTFTFAIDTSSASSTKSEPESVPDWEQKLSKIKAGKEDFQSYENLCIDILKYVLGDYLTLWAEQEYSNDDMYRFDLCCKIKTGTNQDFFETIKNYFKTKYIVFEFKNYTDEIGQKEIYTTEKYLYEKALRKVAIIISRKGADEHAIKATKGSLRESGKLILCLSDKDLLDMIDIKIKAEQEPADILVNKLDDLLVHLEK